LISPWQVELSEENGYALSPKRTVQIANPASFLAQKILIHPQRDYKDRAKDLLYMHDTIEVFSECLHELQKLFRDDVAPKLHARSSGTGSRACRSFQEGRRHDSPGFSYGCRTKAHSGEIG
jgi:hypothetical protein